MAPTRPPPTDSQEATKLPAESAPPPAPADALASSAAPAPPVAPYERAAFALALGRLFPESVFSDATIYDAVGVFDAAARSSVEEHAAFHASLVSATWPALDGGGFVYALSAISLARPVDVMPVHQVAVHGELKRLQAAGVSAPALAHLVANDALESDVEAALKFFLQGCQASHAHPAFAAHVARFAEIFESEDFDHLDGETVAFLELCANLGFADIDVCTWVERGGFLAYQGVPDPEADCGGCQGC
ncbi:hypothetical protein M885DRAFT_520936 [Pelagophyceae sp. CCMP2097]|nr:hypothetical protein M885DRAFT_520936 [Pelagophyceae sp. CCMP2097]